MNRILGLAAFALGLAAVVWVGAGYIGSNALALMMTALIGAFYLMGALELQRFHRATAGLRAALEALPDALPSLAGWLAQVPASLQNPVRLRIEGERIGLPGPAMTPYLVGLLVVLGMLGTFLGMVVTLKGAVMALESTTDLATIRAALAAPVKGLGLAFGTSVAGVAASAMLGLVSALCRRERLDAAQWLDTHIATTLRVHTLAHQRLQMLEAVQRQSEAMPAWVGQLQTVVTQMERHHVAFGERLFASQAHFHANAQVVHAELAASVDRTLKETLSESARAAGAALQPVVAATMSGIARETAAFQQRMGDAVQAQLEGVSARFDSTVNTLTGTWRDALTEQQRSSEAQSVGLRAALDGVVARAGEQAATLLGTIEQAHARQQADVATAERQRLAAWSQSLAAMSAALRDEWQRAGAQSLDQQQQICATLEQTARDMQAHADEHMRGTMAELSRLIDAAAQAPRVAAEVVTQLREKLSDSMARDNTLLDERARILATLGTLLDTVNRAATEQRGAIDALVASAAVQLQQTGAMFGERIEASAARIDEAATLMAAGGVEVASLGEAFGTAVQLFSKSSEALTGHLQRIEAALGKSTARSDEQLGYFVAQAREIIDLSISSQKQIVDELQQLARQREPVAELAG